MRFSYFSRNKLKTIELENSLTPLEQAALLSDRKTRQLPFKLAELLRERSPRPYERHPVAPNVNLYSGQCGATELLVGFCGRSNRMMMPISCFLQLIDEQQYDVLVLGDASRRHYEAGLPEYSSTFLETLRQIDAFAASRRYERLLTYGTSMGGLAAIRAGLWLGAARAISVGGRFCSHPPRLTDASHEIPAFDLLCSCRFHHRHTEVIAVFSARNGVDAHHYARLKNIVGWCDAITVDSSDHNAYRDLSAQELEELFARLFSSSHSLRKETAPLAH